MTRNDEIRARLEAATPGPWVTRFIYRLFKAARKDPNTILGDPERDWANAELIAHAPADLAHLLAENERQAERIAGLVCALHQIESITIVWRSGDEADRLREINDTAGAALRGGAEALEAR